MATYKIYGDYGYQSETLLWETDDRAEALRWAERAGADGVGGHDVIEVARFADDGEYMTVMVYRAEDLSS